MQDEPDNKVVPFDMTKIRPSMRSMALRLYIELHNPMNNELWNPLPTSDTNHTTSKEVLGSLGTINDIGKVDDDDAASRILHFATLALHAINTGQYGNKNLKIYVETLLNAAQSVSDRLAKKKQTA